MRNKLKNLLVLGSLGLSAIGLSGCNSEQNSTYDGYAVKVITQSCGNHILRLYEKQKDGGCIFAQDGGDKRFDEVQLLGVRRGSPIEKYASVEKLAEIYSEVTGEDKAESVTEAK